MPPMPLMPRNSRATSADRARFRCSFTAILPCCSAAWPAPLPLSTFTAFLGLYCLCRSAAWPAPPPLSTFTAFLGMGDFVCSVAFVDFYCLSRLLLPWSICCLACSAILTLTTGCRNLLIISTILLSNFTCGFQQTLSLYRDRSPLVYIYIYIYIYTSGVLSL